MTKTLMDVVKILQSKGESVSYRKRKDGSIVIKSIGTMKYKGREGNKAARIITGAPMSNAETSQRRRAANRANFFKSSGKSHLKKTNGLTKPQRKFIRNYNAAVDHINEKYSPTRPLAHIGAKQARAALSRGESFSSWKRRAISQAKSRALDLPLGAGGVSERRALASYIKWRYGQINFSPALKVANYIKSHRVTQSYLEKLHDLAYRGDTANLNWNNAYEEAVKSNKKIKEEIQKILNTFNSLL